MSKKKIWRVVLFAFGVALCLVAAGCSPSEAGITLNNQLGYTLSELYVSPADDTEWGENRLSQPLRTEGSISLLLSEISDIDVRKGAAFDIFAMDEDGDYYHFYDVQIADRDQIVLTSDENFHIVAQITPKKGDMRTTQGTMTFADEEENHFLGQWMSEEEEDLLYVFLEDGLFEVLDLTDDGAVIASGTYTFHGDSGTITAAESDGAPVEISAKLINDSTMTLDYEGTIVVFTRQEGDMTASQSNPNSDAGAAASTQLTPTIVPDRTYTDEGNSKIKFRDYDLGIFATYPSWMSIAEDYFSDAVLVCDGYGGYVTLRDVTDAYYAYSGSDNDFITQYIEQYVIPDYMALYESDGVEHANFELVNHNASNRVATANINLYSTNYDIQVHSLIYTSTYSNGDVRVISKSFFADYDDGDQMQTLYDDVSSGACRRS